MRVAFWVIICVLAWLFGYLERVTQARGNSNAFLTISQGVLVWLLFGLFIAGFFLFTWKIALLAVLAGFGVAALSSSRFSSL